MSKPKIRSDAHSLVALLAGYGIDALQLEPGSDGWHSRGSLLHALRHAQTVPQHIAASAPPPQRVVAAGGPWGDGDPVQWALDTGRVHPRGAAAWRADYRRDPLGIGRLLTELAPVLAESGGRIAASARITSSTPSSRPGRGDAYAVNPLVDQVRPWPVMASAGQGGPLPSLFESGDTPPLTASGLPPERLLDLPWQARHAVAAERDPGAALEAFERYVNSPDEAAVDFAGHGGNRMYETRVNEWLDASMTPDERFAAVYGDEALAEAKAAERADREQRRAAAERQLRAVDDEEG
jgi:hypothetical protein